MKVRCFAPYPFPDADDVARNRIGVIAEELDAHRKQVCAEHPHLTLTGLYNVLERLRVGTNREALDDSERHILDDGLVLILKDLHDRLDVAVAAAYEWPIDLTEELAGPKPVRPAGDAASAFASCGRAVACPLGRLAPPTADSCSAATRIPI